MLPKSIGLAPTAVRGAFAGEMQAQRVPPWGPLGMRVQGSRGSQVGFLNESVLCIISALEELWRNELTGENRENFFSWGGESPNLPIRSLPLPISGIPHPTARTPHPPGSATPDSHGHLIAGSRTSFNSSLIFSLNKGCSASSLLFYPAKMLEKTANTSAFPPRQPRSAQGETVPARKVNIICSYYLCCDSSQSPNRSPNAIALRLFTHTERGSPSESLRAELPSRKACVSHAASSPGLFTAAGASHPPSL